MAFDSAEDDVFRILDEFSRSDATFLQVKTGGFELTVSRLADPPESHAADPPVSMDAAGTPTAAEAAGTPMSADSPGTRRRADPVETDLHVVSAPVVGVFYAAPGPGEQPYVHAGAHVEPDTTVGLVEAMKVFTAVLAETSGVVAEIFVGNGDFVEFGQPLMAVRPLGPSS